MIAPLYGSSVDGRYPIGTEAVARLGRIFGLGQYDGGGGGGDGFDIAPVDFSIPDFTVPDTSFIDIHAGDATPAAPEDTGGLIPLPMDLPLGPAPDFQLQETLPYQGYVDAGLITPDEQIAIANGDITIDQLLGLSADQGMVILPTDTPAQAAAKKAAASGGGAPSGGGSSGGGGGKPSAQQDPQTAAAIAALQKQLAQMQAAGRGSTAQAAQLKAQIAALGGGTSWLTQKTIFSSLPNWGVLAIAGAAVFVLPGAFAAGRYQVRTRR